MAIRGTKPKPTEIAKRDGTTPSRIPNPPLRTGPDASVEMPDDFNPYQQRAWKQIVKDLTDLDVLDSADRSSVELAAAMLGRMREARKELKNSEMIEYTQRGAAVPSPWWRIEREAALLVHKALAEIGLSPSARARLANTGTQSRKATESLDDLLGTPGHVSAKEKV